jgi:hypothetical protein
VSSPAEWTIPGRPADWPRIEPIEPGRGRELAHWFYDWGHFEMGDAIMAEVQAVEAQDQDAWLAALAAQVGVI